MRQTNVPSDPLPNQQAAARCHPFLARPAAAHQCLANNTHAGNTERATCRSDQYAAGCSTGAAAGCASASRHKVYEHAYTG